jgi:hypothetical protein
MKKHLGLAIFVVLPIGQTAVMDAVRALAAHLDVGWSEEFNDPGQWDEDVSLLRRPAIRRRFFVQEGHDEFWVTDPARGARWTETTEPIWASDHKYFVIRYRAERVKTHSGEVVALRLGSVGPVTPGVTLKLKPGQPSLILRIFPSFNGSSSLLLQGNRTMRRSPSDSVAYGRDHSTTITPVLLAG